MFFVDQGVEDVGILQSQVPRAGQRLSRSLVLAEGAVIQAGVEPRFRRRGQLEKDLKDPSGSPRACRTTASFKRKSLFPGAIASPFRIQMSAEG